MSNYISVVLKGEVYKIRYDHKPKLQRDLSDLDDKIDRLKGELMNLQNEKKKLTVDLLNERQLIIYKNGYNRFLPSSELENDKRYKKRMQLLKEYDDRHGTYIEPV